MEELIERANDTYYGEYSLMRWKWNITPIVLILNITTGLAAGVLTKDINTALTFAQAVEAGSVWYVVGYRYWIMILFNFSILIKGELLRCYNATNSVWRV